MTMQDPVAAYGEEEKGVKHIKNKDKGPLLQYNCPTELHP